MPTQCQIDFMAPLNDGDRIRPCHVSCKIPKRFDGMNGAHFKDKTSSCEGKGWQIQWGKLRRRGVILCVPLYSTAQLQNDKDFCYLQFCILLVARQDENLNHACSWTPDIGLQNHTTGSAEVPNSGIDCPRQTRRGFSHNPCTVGLDMQRKIWKLLRQEPKQPPNWHWITVREENLVLLLFWWGNWPIFTRIMPWGEGAQEASSLCGMTVSLAWRQIDSGIPS